MIRQPSGVTEFRDIHAYMVCASMRENEVRQLMAFSDGSEFDHEVAARVVINKPGVRFTVVDSSDSPLVVGGYMEVASGVWQSWMIGTDEAWRFHWRQITKASLWLKEKMFEGGARRLQDSCLVEREDACKWIQAIGFRLEGVWKEFGINGEDVAFYAVTRSQHYGQQS